jgi:hypothetical protein
LILLLFQRHVHRFRGLLQRPFGQEAIPFEGNPEGMLPDRQALNLLIATFYLSIRCGKPG